MKLQDQVCTLEQAKKLKELGVSQESLFCFIGDDNPDPKYNLPHDLYYSDQAREEVGASWWEHRIVAFTVAELGAMLPDSICTNSNIRDAELIVRNEVTEWKVGYDYDRPTMGGIDKMHYTARRGKTEAEARAEMLIVLLEDEKTTVEEVNERLCTS